MRSIAMIVWREARDPRGTLVEQYLKSRGRELPAVAADEAIRFHNRCKFDTEYFPAMVCLVRNILTNAPQAIHRTALGPDGTAIKRNGETLRMSLGPVTAGAIKIDPDEDVEQGLCIGEGVESSLAGRQMGFRPVWSAVATAGIKNFPVLPWRRASYHGRAHVSTASALAPFSSFSRNMCRPSRDVIIVDPDDAAKDLNDELLETAP